MVFLEWAVIAYHVIFLSTCTAVLVDYMLATEKLTRVREFLDDDGMTPLFGMEIIMVLIAILAGITGVQFMWSIVQAITVLILMGLLAALVLGAIGTWIQKLRDRNLAKKE